MKRILLSLLIAVIYCFDINAQSQISFNRLSVENGLSQSSITCILQDSRGFMWFGTQDGLNRYDGYKFKIFKNDPTDSTTLSESWIFSIYEDIEGVLYVGTQSGEFNKYNPLTESFSRVNRDEIKDKGLRISTVGALYEDPKGIRWQGGLGSGTGLIRTDKKTGSTKVYKHDPSNPFSISDDKVYSVYRDREGRLWIGTFSGLNRFDESTEKFYHFRNDPDDPNSLPDNWVWPVFQDSDGHLWVGTVKSGLCRFDPEANIFTPYRNDPADPASISNNFIFSIHEDKSGMIWVGTNSGLNYFHSSSQAFEFYGHNPSVKNSLSEKDILSAFVDNKGIYWLGTRNGGLNSFDYAKKSFRNYPVNGVQVFHHDVNGNLWLGTFSNGLAKFNPSSGSVTYFTNNPADSNSLSDNRVYALYADKENYLWVGTYGGINRFDPRTGKAVRYRYDSTSSSSISSDKVWSLIEDNSGNIWAGTFEAGITIIGPDRKSFRHIRNNPQDPESLVDDLILRLFKDKKGNIWIGTTKGISKYLPDKNTFKNYSEEDGLPNNYIFGIVEDGAGDLWISTNNGLSRFDPAKETFKNFYEQDGLQGNEFNQFAFANDTSTGHLLFGGINGLTVFNPENISSNKFLPPVVFTEYLRYNTDDEEGKPIIEKGITVRDSIVLTYKDNIVTLSFAALSYYNNFENQYKYMLEGFNDNWIQLGNDHSITFTNLSPGDYILRVIGSNNDGYWNNEGALIYIDVLPPWWRTNIAYAIYGILFVSGLYGLRKFELDRREKKTYLRETELRMKATEAEKKVIEAENERKTKELEEARQLQLSMLPKELPKLPNLEIAAFMRTATEVGGDYYDFICQQNGVLNVAFGDATGHGLQAGTMVTLMKGFFTSDAARLELTDFMNHCSNMIKEIKLGRILMSFSFMRIHDSKMSVTSGGMPPLYYFDYDSRTTEELMIQGMPLGAMRKYNYKKIDKELKKGDTILLLTDGLPEQMNSNEEMYNYQRVKERFNELAELGPEEIIKELIKTGDEWMGDALQADDISMVVIKVK
jgi:ligand-binding sensor domain-containing protein/serine phosphatase RsbU (regulator of sigma subunit)